MAKRVKYMRKSYAKQFSHSFSQFPLISNEHRACPSISSEPEIYECLGFLIGGPYGILILDLSQKFLTWHNLPSYEG